MVRPVVKLLTQADRVGDEFHFGLIGVGGSGFRFKFQPLIVEEELLVLEILLDVVPLGHLDVTDKFLGNPAHRGDSVRLAHTADGVWNGSHHANHNGGHDHQSDHYFSQSEAGTAGVDAGGFHGVEWILYLHMRYRVGTQEKSSPDENKFPGAGGRGEFVNFL